MALIPHAGFIQVFAYRGVFFRIEATDDLKAWKLTDEHGHEATLNSLTDLKELHLACNTICNDRHEKG